MRPDPRRDPREYCPVCDRRYGPTEEACSGCGFNPCDDDMDAEFEEAAKAVWEEKNS